MGLESSEAWWHAVLTSGELLEAYFLTCVSACVGREVEERGGPTVQWPFDKFVKEIYEVQRSSCTQGLGNASVA